MNSNAYGNIVAIDAPVEERMAFLKKVYFLLSLSVFTSAVACWMTISNVQFLEAVYNNRILLYLCEIGAIFFVYWARHKPNLGYIALFSFTILTGMTTSILVFNYRHVVVEALTITGFVFAGLSLYAVQSKKDFSFLQGFLFVGVLALLIGGLLNLFLFKSEALMFFMSIGGVLIFSGFILYDTSNILKTYPTNEYISATLALYIDVLMLFKYIIILLGGSRE